MQTSRREHTLRAPRKKSHNSITSDVANQRSSVYQGFLRVTYTQRWLRICHGFSNAGWRSQNVVARQFPESRSILGSVGQKRRIFAVRSRYNPAAVHLNIICSARLRQIFHDSDLFDFFILMISVRGYNNSPEIKFGVDGKTQKTPAICF